MPHYHGRFAPTPSGALHFGSMVAALGSFCDARACDGRWSVRIDDIDAPRVVSGVSDDILRTLEAFALEWDGRPVFQRESTDAYHQTLHRLRAKGLLFACSCSRREISAAGLSGLEGPIYPGTCRNGLREGSAARSLRLRVSDEPRCDFTDALQGDITQSLAGEVGDFVLYRADGIFSYHLACVVDDARQGISHVVRGADLIDSTPRQIYLQRLLRLVTPSYLHLPVAVNSAGQKLSKQTRAAPVLRAHPARTIYLILRLLGQGPPAELAQWTARAAMDWAVKAWRRDKLPFTRSIGLPLT